MELSLKNREWKSFLIGKEFELKNSKAYHKTNLKETLSNNGVPYVSRTNLNNGLETIVQVEDNFQLNQIYRL